MNTNATIMVQLQYSRKVELKYIALFMFYIFVGFMFIGMGIGYLMNNLLVGMFIGMGFGFIARVFITPSE